MSKVEFKNQIVEVPEGCPPDSAKWAKWVLEHLGAGTFLRSRKLRLYASCVRPELEAQGARFAFIEELQAEGATLPDDAAKPEEAREDVEKPFNGGAEAAQELAVPHDSQERSQRRPGA